MLYEDAIIWGHLYGMAFSFYINKNFSVYCVTSSIFDISFKHQPFLVLSTRTSDVITGWLWHFHLYINKNFSVYSVTRSMFEISLLK